MPLLSRRCTIAQRTDLLSLAPTLTSLSVSFDRCIPKHPVSPLPSRRQQKCVGKSAACVFFPLCSLPSTISWDFLKESARTLKLVQLDDMTLLKGTWVELLETIQAGLNLRGCSHGQGFCAARTHINIGVYALSGIIIAVRTITIKNTFFVVESAHYKMKSNFPRIGVIERHRCSEVVEERGIAKKVVRTL